MAQGGYSSKRLADAEEECADVFPMLTVEFKSVVETEYDERVADAKAEPTGLAEVAKPEIRHLGEDVPDVNKTHGIKYPKERVAQLVVEDEYGVATDGSAIR
jgi:hypothetical protein